jgi:hypothetical protein
MLALSRRAAPEGVDGGDKVRVQVLDVSVEWSNDRSGEEMGKRRTGDSRIGPFNRAANVADQAVDSVVAHDQSFRRVDARASPLAAPRGVPSE